MKVSIVIPVFNQEKYIRNAIDSCLKQTYTDIEIIIINDGSTDSTIEILNDYKNKIIVLNQENGGTSSAWNNALRVIDTEYVIGLDSDDEFVPNTVQDIVDFAKKHSNYSVIYSDYSFIDYQGTITRTVHNPDTDTCEDAISKLILLCDNLGKPNNFLPFGHARLYKTAALLEINGYDVNYRYAEDFDLMLRLAASGHSFARCPKILYHYRWHESNKGVISRGLQKGEVRKCIAQFRNQIEYNSYDQQRD